MRRATSRQSGSGPNHFELDRIWLGLAAGPITNQFNVGKQFVPSNQLRIRRQAGTITRGVMLGQGFEFAVFFREERILAVFKRKNAEGLKTRARARVLLTYPG